MHYPKAENANTFIGNSALYYAAHCSDGSKVFLSQGPTIMTVPDETSQTTTTVYGDVRNIITGASIYRVFASRVTSGLLFAILNDANVYRLCRSTDSGATWTVVLTLGAGNGVASADSTHVRVLETICECAVDYPAQAVGRGHLIIGEYNANTSRTNGGTNDRVRILRSTDGGATWAAEMTWNTDGTNKVGHVHLVKQDQYTGHVYVCVGDENAKDGVIRWDGVSEWTDNTALSGIAAWDGFDIMSGSQSCRTVGLIIDENSIYTMTDSSDIASPDTEKGIWKWAKDLSSKRRVYSGNVTYDNHHIGWLGEKIGGAYVFLSGVEWVSGGTKWTKETPQIYTSWDGENWGAGGEYRLADGTAVASATLRGPSVAFVHSGKLWTQYSSASYKSCPIAIDFTAQADISDEPNVVWPVFYVGTWLAAGNDSTGNGLSKNTPWATLKKSMESSLICYGARVRLAAATYSQPSIYPIWSAGTLPALASECPVIIDGGDKASTVIQWASGGANYLLYLESARIGSVVCIKRATLKNPGAALLLQVRAGVDLRTHDAIIGDTADGNYGLVSVVATAFFKPRRSFVFGNRDGANTATLISNDGTLDITSSVVYGGYRHASGGGAVSVKNSVMDGCLYRVMELYGSAPVPIIKNSYLNSDATYTISNYVSGLADSGIDYCMLKKPVAGFTAAGGLAHNLAQATDPKFTNAAAYDYRPQVDSPLIRAGVNLSVPHGLDGIAIEQQNGADIGPYSYMPGWTLFDGTMPPLALASTAPGDLKQAQAWSKVATAKEIEKNKP